MRVFRNSRLWVCLLASSSFFTLTSDSYGQTMRGGSGRTPGNAPYFNFNMLNQMMLLNSLSPQSQGGMGGQMQGGFGGGFSGQMQGGFGGGFSGQMQGGFGGGFSGQMQGGMSGMMMGGMSGMQFGSMGGMMMGGGMGGMPGMQFGGFGGGGF
jgi:hypothetical protein